MRFLTLEQIKQQLRIEPDFNEDDAYLEHLGEVAEMAVENDLNRTLYVTDVPESDPFGLRVNVRHQQAMLLMVGNLYENRESTTPGTIITEVPLTYQHLIERDRVITV